jgi:hypothetical protein
MPRYHDEEDDEGHIDMGPLLRIGVWGVCAVVALSGVVFAGRTDVGGERAQLALATLREAPREIITHPGNLLAARSADDAETKRLTETVRKLTADRDRLSARVATLEQNLNDLTGSIARAQPPAQNAAAAPAAASRPDTAEAFPPPAPPDVASTSSAGGDSRSIAPPANQPAAPAATAPTTARPSRMATIESYVTSSTPPAAAGPSEARVAATTPTPDAAPPADTPANGFAIDLGTATNVNTLRAHWGSIKTAHPTILDGMRPLVSVRQSSRPGFTEFHLVAGPIADADAAAKICQLLANARVACRPSTFDGQRLDLR